MTRPSFLPLRILATGKAVPERCVSSEELDDRFDRPRGWSFSQSGVRRRYLADVRQRQSDLAAQALRHALSQAGLEASALDLVLSAAAIPEQALPSMAGGVAALAGVPAGVPAFDVNASCLGFLAALDIAAHLLHGGRHQRIAIVASDLPSRGIDWNEPEASLIFGDGAAAAIVAASEEGEGILAYRMQTWPAGRQACEIRAGGTRCTPRTGVKDDDFLFRMDGPELFRRTLTVVDSFMSALFAGTCAAAAPLSLADIDVVVPHQASHLSMRHLRHHLGISRERVVDIYVDHGNQVSASLPTALHEARVTGRLQRGRKALLLGTAAGISMGGMVLQL